MNSIEWQVTSLELSKKLKELGVKQASIWWWTNGLYIEDYGWSLNHQEQPRLRLGNPQEDNRYGDPGKEIWYCSAFTCAELGKMLPDGIETIKIIEKFDMNYGKWSCGDKLARAYDVLEANARAKMLIHLKESGSVKP